MIMYQGTKEVTIYTCLRCSHDWQPRKDKIPKVCPKCHSPYWREPRRNKGEK